MKKFEEKTIQSQEIFNGKIIQLRVDEVELPNGKMAKREIVKHPGAVGIIPITDDGNILMVEQFRKPLERSLLEIPAGKLEQGEEPLLTAGRELEEETGFRANQMDHLTSFYTAPGFSDEVIHLYIATGLEKVENPLPGDEDEFVDLLEVDLKSAAIFIDEKRIYDAKTAYAVLYLQMKKVLEQYE
ncbi:ADP-ribose pyrophosphatase [Bacillus sp. J14TS2]|uniref:NUDIX domain-containing protein n=1 Tax=Bacillus sp. J14TS2 TaxID=2807188 RepID=UPI001B2C43A9|nr:NUDIX hydrolase [Bacillus sp. J14TS2]GIN73494.1 ADP-ribose pyrophosphatase [Bacillus sp. J14TS2]